MRRTLRVPLSYERGDTTSHTTIWLVPVAFPWRMLPLTVALVGIGALVMVRRPGTRVARAFFLLGIAYALHWTFFFGGSRQQTYAWIAVLPEPSTALLLALAALPVVRRQRSQLIGRDD